MTAVPRRPIRLWVLTALFAAGGCFAAPSSASGLSGTVNVSGSSTVEPVSALAAEDFVSVVDGVVLNVDGPGTGDGFELFCGGDVQVTGASRPIRAEEAAACETNGVRYIELLIAQDGISVLTTAANRDLECLSLADLYAIAGPEAEGFDDWSEAASLAEELGSTTPFPPGGLELSGPGAESGTYDSFVELVIAPFAEERGHEPTSRTDYEASSDDNVIVRHVAAGDTSVGWVGYAFAVEAGDDVVTVAVSEDPGGDCVVPTAESIAANSYPISRPLFIYVNLGEAESSPAVAAYVDHYLTNLESFVTEAGYVPLDQNAVEQTRRAWRERITP